ncbi:hypothetical protein GCM10008985_34920 [Halococcus dombrowskii]|uniref:Uncharacterized protein n=1 Tax=Halococcus dombrowskii TaxID=179637 RepID=A0AAV3SLW9_HALDO
MNHAYTLESTVLQLQVPQFLQETVAGIIAFLPVLLSAIVVLLVGWILGRLLGAVVTRVVEGIGLSKYTQGTPLEQDDRGDGGIAGALGKLVKYIVYFYAALAASDILGIAILSQLLSDIGTFLPVILSAVVVLVIGFVVGRIVGGIVTDVVGGFNLGSYFHDTPLERVTRSAGGIGGIVGTLVEYYIYFLTLLTAAGILQIPALSRLLNDFAGFVPALIGGVAVLIVGALAAEFVEDVVASTDGSRLTDLVGLGVKLFVYYLAITIALDTMGFDSTVLTTLFASFVTAFFGALAVALALAIGIGLGWGSKDYVAENIDDWLSSARSSADDLTDEEGSTGTRGTDDRDTFDDDDTRGGSGPSGTGDPDV